MAHRRRWFLKTAGTLVVLGGGLPVATSGTPSAMAQPPAPAGGAADAPKAGPPGANDFRLVAVQLTNREGQGQVLLSHAGTVPKEGLRLLSSAANIEAALSGTRWLPADQLVARGIDPKPAPAAPWAEPFRIDVGATPAAQLDRQLAALKDRPIRLLTLNKQNPDVRGRLLTIKDHVLTLEGVESSIPLDSVVVVLPASGVDEKFISWEIHPVDPTNEVPNAKFTQLLPGKPWKPFYRWQLDAPAGAVEMFALVVNGTPYAWRNCRMTLVDGPEEYEVVGGNIAAGETALVRIRPINAEAAKELDASVARGEWWVDALPATEPPTATMAPQRWATWTHLAALSRFWKPGGIHVYEGPLFRGETSTAETLSPSDTPPPPDRRTTFRIALGDVSRSKILRTDQELPPTFPTLEKNVLKFVRSRNSTFTWEAGAAAVDTWVVVPAEGKMPTTRIRLTTASPASVTFQTKAQLRLDQPDPALLHSLATLSTPKTANANELQLQELLKRGDEIQQKIVRLIVERRQAVERVGQAESRLALALTLPASLDRDKRVGELERMLAEATAHVRMLETQETLARSDYDELIRAFLK